MRAPIHRPAARADISDILKTSSRMFGPRARRNYKALIDRALNRLYENPQSAGVQHHDDLPGISLSKQARHIIVFTYDDTTLTILRVLHDSMDIAERVGDDTNDT